MKRKDYKVFTQFVPETDVDGIDAKPEILSWLQNAKIGNGFIRVLPVSEEITSQFPELASYSSYIIKGFTSYYHSSQGKVEVFVLWNGEVAEMERIKILVNGEEVIQQLIFSGSSPRYVEEPKNVNFHLINDELKINLNCIANVTFRPEPMILNLTLAWLEEVSYVSNDNNLVREAGWHLFYRWLGVQAYNHYTTVVSIRNYYELIGIGTPKSWIEDFEDNTMIPGFSYNNLRPGFDPLTETLLVRGNKKKGVENGNLSTTGITYYRSFKIENLRNLDKISFDYTVRGYLGGVMRFEILIEYPDKPLSERYVSKLMYEYPAESYITDSREEKIEVPIGEFSEKTFNLIFEFTVPPYITGGGTVPFHSLLYIDNLKLEASDGMILGRYYNGQRALLTITGFSSEEGTLIGVYGDNPVVPMDLRIEVFRGMIDYRIVEYEVYLKNPNDNLYYKRFKAEVDGQWQIDINNPSTIITKFLTKVDEVQTLNFNYGLGVVRVDNQFNILSEALLSGRVHAITGDYKIRISHIAGNGKVQPDSFPYDEDKNFGFIEESRNTKLLSTILLDETNLALISDKGISIYSSYSNRGVSIKQLRLAMQDFNNFNPKSLTRAITGISNTTGFFFTTSEGIWYHTGEYQAIPKNLILGRLEEYWKDAKKDGIGVYLPETKEYWYEVKNNEFLVYEVAYDSFRIQTAPATDMQSAVINTQGELVIVTNKKLYKWSKKNNSYSLSGFTTHRNNLETEYYNKVLHSIEVDFESETPATAYVYVRVDGDKVYFYKISNDEKRKIRLFPLSVRCKEVMVSVLFPIGSLADKSVKVRGFSLFYTVDGEVPELSGSPLTYIPVTQTGLYGRNYGRDYIVM